MSRTGETSTSLVLEPLRSFVRSFCKKLFVSLQSFLFLFFFRSTFYPFLFSSTSFFTITCTRKNLSNGMHIHPEVYHDRWYFVTAVVPIGSNECISGHRNKGSVNNSWHELTH